MIKLRPEPDVVYTVKGGSLWPFPTPDSPASAEASWPAGTPLRCKTVLQPVSGMQQHEAALFVDPGGREGFIRLPSTIWGKHLAVSPLHSLGCIADAPE